MKTSTTHRIPTFSPENYSRKVWEIMGYISKVLSESIKIDVTNYC